MKKNKGLCQYTSLPPRQGDAQLTVLSVSEASSLGRSADKLIGTALINLIIKL